MTESNYRRFSCTNCAVTFESVREKKYCSRECNIRYLKRIGPQMTREQYLTDSANPANRFVCEHCNQPSKRKLSGTNTARGVVSRWCSMGCRVAAAKAGEFSLCFGLHCIGCASPFVSRRERGYCTKECELKTRRVGAQCAAQELHKKAGRQTCCIECEAVFCPLYGSSSAILCMPCAIERSHLYRAAIRSFTKARLRGATVEMVDPIKVLDRDRWTCQLCGCATPKRLRGTYDDRAPEVDHIIPIAKGGEHSYRNTQCACRKCNGKKSDTPLGQLLMFG